MGYHVVKNCFIYDSSEYIPSCHSSSIAEMPNGDIMAIWFGGIEEAHPDAAHYCTFLRKGQSHFDEPELFWNIPGKSAGNPRIFCDSRQRAWAILPVNEGKWCSGGTKNYYKVSDDNGRTWSEAAYMPGLDSFLGKNKPILLDNSRIIFPMTREDTQSSYALIFDPDNLSWELSSEITIGENVRCIQPTFVKLKDGRIMGLLRTNIGNIWKTYSADGGLTWSKTQKTILPNNNSGIDMTRLDSGEIILIYNNNSDEQKRTPLTIAISDDEGMNWKNVYILESSEGEFSYPAVIQSRDRKINISYTYLNGSRNTHGRNGTHIKFVTIVQATAENLCRK